MQVTLMIPPAMGCPHDYELTVKDMRKVAGADVFVANGLGMEEYLFIVVLLWLGAYGAGPLSLDAFFARRLERSERPLPGRVAEA